MEIIRPPAVAWMFYPAELYVLRNMIKRDIALESCPRIENLLDNCSLPLYLVIFSPSVLKFLSKPSGFIYHLKMKTGLPRSFWLQDLPAYRYATDSFLITLAY